jgi:hypothetical protein
MASNRLTVCLKKKPAMQVSRVSVGRKKLVYVIVVPKPIKYPWDRSRVAYIGTTKRGVARIAQSAAAKAQDVLSLHGIREFHVRIITCAPRPGVETWRKLERALLLTFRHRYGKLPVCNKVGKNIKPRDDFDYFKRERLEKLLEALA